MNKDIENTDGFIYYLLCINIAGQTFLVGAINTFVHSIMYTYYLMTIWYPEIRANIAVKKAITSLQMVKFAHYN